eukprot:GFUD01029362.1.p1 GENE.GFUD01029362.1~~GFUD01029362.1.p1  ORF type:complete len:184 (-),score=55.93 GFUD01029362.1:268-819(-)
MVYEHEVHQPRLWTKPISKVYDANRISGEFYYKPMVDYIDWKQKYEEYQPTNPLERKKVDLPSALEASKADISCLSSGRPNFLSFLAQYGAKQIKDTNMQTARVKHEFARKSKKSETIPRQKRTSVMIRDQYISSVDTMYKTQLKLQRAIDEEEERKNMKEKNEHEYLRYAFNVHGHTHTDYA